MKFESGGSSTLGGRTNNRKNGTSTFLSRMSKNKAVGMAVIGGCSLLVWNILWSDRFHIRPRIVPKGGYAAFPLRSSLPLASARSTSASTTSSGTNLSTIPMVTTFPKGTKSIVLNIGTNYDPILPALRAGPCSKVLAFEPMVPDSIKPHPQILVIPAAISNRTGLSLMEKYNNGLCSSLGTPTTKGRWIHNNRGGEISKRLVPTYTLTEVLHSIPEHIQINLIYTDMQGYDFVAISEAISTLRERQVAYIYNEVTIQNTPSYEGVPSDLCRDWLPFMLDNGYEYVGALNGVVDIDKWYQTTMSWFGLTSNPYDDANRIHQICQQEIQQNDKVSYGMRETNALWRLKDLNPIAYQDKTSMQQLNELVYKSTWKGGSKVFTEENTIPAIKIKLGL